MYLQFPGVIELPLQRLPFSLIEGTKNMYLTSRAYLQMLSFSLANLYGFLCSFFLLSLLHFFAPN